MTVAESLLEDSVAIEKSDFNSLVIVGTKHLLHAMKEQIPGDVFCLGRGLSWLSRIGLLEELQIACKRDESGASRAVVQGLRDACCEELQRAHQQWLLLTVTPAWEDRVAVAEEWCDRSAEGEPILEAWELAASLLDMVEAVCAQDRLAGILRKRADRYS